MKTGIRIALTGTASASLLALTGCAGLFGPDLENPPLLSEIDDLMWQSMEEAGSVTMTADLDDFAKVEPESADAMRQMIGDELSDLRIYGALDGSGTAISLDDNDLMIGFGGDEAYLSGNAIFGLLEQQSFGFSAQEEEMLNELSDEFSDSWLDYSDELENDAAVGDSFDIRTLLDELQDSWEDGDDGESPVEREKLSDEGTHEIRNDQDVWIYEGEEEGQELVLEADPDAPKIKEITNEDDVSLKFSKWGDTEAPQRPDDSDIITEQEFEQRVNEAVMGGSSFGTSPNESEFDVDTPNDNPFETDDTPTDSESRLPEPKLAE
ncbi:MAG TPA: hypothetical protein H9884_06925 [Candidatus Yaniella excrementigallinarum]|nr:hypothetical protein [Candidatus Yaniella excrementigallinarum]